MGQAFDAQTFSDSSKSNKQVDTSSIEKFVKEHYGKTNIVKETAEKTNQTIDLQKLFEKNPLYAGQDDDYIKKQWKAGAVDSPTEKESRGASDKLKAGINPLLTEGDKQSLEKAQAAILKGDPTGLKDVLSQYKNNPEALKAFVNELNQSFDKNDVALKLKANGDRVNLSGMTGGGYSDVDFDTSSGKVTASFGTLGRASFDGSISMDPEAVMKRMGNRAVQSITKSSD